MFHIDLSSKRAKLALRFFTYGVMTLATIILTAAAIFYAMGYRFNQNQLDFEQGGLIQFRSVPQNAKVYIDGALESFTTPGRMNVNSGTHTVEMQLDGYNSWKKTITLNPGQLLWLNYARLFPTSITTNDVGEIAGARSALASPNRRWQMVHTQGVNFKLVDLADPKKVLITDFAIPEDMLIKKDGALGEFILKEWDLGSRYVLVEHINKDAHEFLRLDHENAANTINISKIFSLNISEAHFAGSNANVLYANTDSALRSLDIGANSASAALINGIEQFVVYGNNTVAFVALRDSTTGVGKQRAVGVYADGKETIARTYTPETPLLIAYSEYTHHAYLAINTGDNIATILRDPAQTNKENAEAGQLKLDKLSMKWLKFSGNGQILVVGSGNSVASYDLELDKQIAWNIDGPTITAPLNWLDDYYLWTDAGGKLKAFEYDGNNAREIANVTPGLTASLSSDGSYLYSYGPAKDSKIPLQSSRLTNQ